ncbi:MAG: hypothetical protein PWP65_2099 [Clostridia bacterium]|nr:hypothetical protein [Clostridia bacterium]
MYRYAYWRHCISGEIYAVALRAVGTLPRWEIVGVCGPLPPGEALPGRQADHKFQADVAWVKKKKGEFEVYSPEEGEE